jgi:uncharacterized membrane protein
VEVLSIEIAGCGSAVVSAKVLMVVTRRMSDKVFETHGSKVKECLGDRT